MNPVQSFFQKYHAVPCGADGKPDYEAATDAALLGHLDGALKGARGPKADAEDLTAVGVEIAVRGALADNPARTERMGQSFRSLATARPDLVPEIQRRCLARCD